MAGRAALVWVGVLAGWLAPAVAPRLRADEPLPPPAVPGITLPPLPPDANLAPPPAVPPSRVVAFQRPPEAAPVVPPPADPFREPPGSPFLPAPPAPSEAILPDGSRVNLPASAQQIIRFSPRYGEYSMRGEPQGDNLDRYTVTGGVIVNVVYLEGAAQREVEFATDNAVAWVRNAKGRNPADGLQTGPGDGGRRMEVELYLAGNVVIRSLSSSDQTGARTVEQVFRAREVYYDVPNNRAIALDGDIELRVQRLPEPIHFRGREIWQLGRNEWRALDSETSSSKRPNDPSLTFTARQSTLTQQYGLRRNVFGIPFRDLRTGELVYGEERVITNERARVRYEGVPLFAWPRTRTDLNDPTGPLAGLTFGNSSIFGFQAHAAWNLFNLLALRPPEGHQWTLNTDYMSDRGPGVGTVYNYTGPNLFGYGGPHVGSVVLYGMRDEGIDQLGGDRGLNEPHPEFRGRARWQHNQELYENGTTYLRAIAQAAYYSDKNFYEQYYKFQFDTAPDQSTFLYLNGGSGNAGGALLTQANVQREWVTETEWYPRADGYLLGESLLWDRLLYSARGDVGYAGLRPAEEPPLPIQPTDRRVDTGRFHLNQELHAPFDAGPFRLDPYGVVDLAHYTEDLTGDARSRFYGAGGLAGSVTLSRLYPEARSELFNVKGLYHKVTLGANYYNAYSDTPYTRLPQLDRLNDENTDFVDRYARPRQADVFDANGNLIRPGLVRGPNGAALATSPVFDPQRYAIRRRVDNKYDTLDTVQVLELDARQRWQTKRGFPGTEHVVDWLAFDLGVSVFPDADRDNFGESWAFLRYHLLWHVGDRTSLESNGWVDPFDVGARYWNVVGTLGRTDGTTFFAGYRHTDPINSRLATGGLNYALTRKYHLNVTANYDFGTDESLSHTVNLARVGSDLTVMLGFSYNSLQQNFGFRFALVPNVAGLSPAQLAYGSVFGTGQR